VKVTRPINAVTNNASYAGRGNYNFLKITGSLLLLLLLLNHSHASVSQPAIMTQANCLSQQKYITAAVNYLFVAFNAALLVKNLPKKRNEAK